MTIVVEDGTGIATANSYASEDDADTYFDDRANSTWTDSTSDKEAALIRASQALDAIYRTRYPGVRTHGRDQGLEWPRTNNVSITSSSILAELTDIQGNHIGTDEIPTEIKQATMELAVRELVTPGVSIPDLERAIKSVRAGSVSVDFAANARESTVFQIVPGIMASLIGGGASSLVGESSRG